MQIKCPKHKISYFPSEVNSKLFLNLGIGFMNWYCMHNKCGFKKEDETEGYQEKY